MEEKKNSFVTQCYKVSDDLGIAKVSVSKILYAFVDKLKGDLYRGKDVRLLGLARITVDGNESCDTLAYSALEVSKSTGISYVTCLNVIKYYLSYLKIELSKGMDIDIRSVFTIHSIRDESKRLVTYHSSLSESLKALCPSARVHTCNFLRSSI